MKHLFRDIVQIYPTPIKDEYGKDSFSASTAYRVRFLEKTKVILGGNGENILSDAEVWLSPDVDISLEDKLTYDSQGYRVIQITKEKDSGTERFIKCYLQRYEI